MDLTIHGILFLVYVAVFATATEESFLNQFTAWLQKENNMGWAKWFLGENLAPLTWLKNLSTNLGLALDAYILTTIQLIFVLFIVYFMKDYPEHLKGAIVGLATQMRMLIVQLAKVVSDTCIAFGCLCSGNFQLYANMHVEMTRLAISKHTDNATPIAIEN